MNFSSKSSEKISTCHNDLQVVLNEAIKWTSIDFGVSHGIRTPEEQNKLYQKGRNAQGEIVDKSKVVTYLDGYRKKSKHNYEPSHAVDIYCWPREIMYDKEHLAAVGHHIMATAKRLYMEGRISHKLRWGNNWDGDGLLVAKDDSERFIDAPHFEIIDS